MLNPALVDAIRRLLADGLSQRQIARQCHVSRGTVQAIAAGKRRDRMPEDDPGLFSGPIGRCPTCGARVYLPCLACRVRQMRRCG